MCQNYGQKLVTMHRKRTGKDNTPNIATINSAHIVSGSRIIVIPFVRSLKSLQYSLDLLKVMILQIKSLL